MAQPEIGVTATAEMRVSEADLASSFHLRDSDDFPKVFATARMIALMEVAASRAVQPFVEEGELSVGVVVDVTHSAATPLGAVVSATAKLTGEEGKLLVFEVVAFDAGGEVGRGTHKRAIVSAARLKAGAAKRCRTS